MKSSILPKAKEAVKKEMADTIKVATEKAMYNCLMNEEQIYSNLQNVLKEMKLPEAALFLKTGKRRITLRTVVAFVTSIVVILVGIIIMSCSTELYTDLQAQWCLVPNNLLVTEISRPVADCGMCQGLRTVPVSENISRESFLENYAYSGRPILIKQATTDWLAREMFDFYFFRDLYSRHPGAVEKVESECSFLQYQTNFSTLAEALAMDDNRVAKVDWYIGWSNCDFDVMKELRNYYERPYFLPEGALSSRLDWIFMGGAGAGAGIHIDTVLSPSWQAQIKGRKTWTLIPPPECEQTCRWLEVTVDTGDILVLDTNQWFHKTYIIDGEMSITIGSEYD